MHSLSLSTGREKGKETRRVTRANPGPEGGVAGKGSFGQSSVQVAWPPRVQKKLTYIALLLDLKKILYNFHKC